MQIAAQVGAQMLMGAAVKSSPSECWWLLMHVSLWFPDKRNWGQWGGNCHWDEHQAPPPIQSTITTPNQSYTKVSRICSVAIPPLKKSLISIQSFDDNIFRGSSCKVWLGPFLGKVYLADFYFLALSIHGCGEKDREEGGRLKVWLQVGGGEEEGRGGRGSSGFAERGEGKNIGMWFLFALH